MPRLNVIIASTRPGRAGASIGQWFTTVAREHTGFDVVLIDLAELNLPMLDEPSPAVEGDPYLHEHTRQWSSITSAADAFVFVMPEYNQGYTAPLKNALDYLYYEWHHKPVGLVSYGMTSGGLRAAQALKPVVSALKMMPLLESVVIHLRQAMSADGTLVPTPAMIEAAKDMLDELQLMISAFAAVRA
jgi:NAD(P)H-dependent FMN reductase